MTRRIFRIPEEKKQQLKDRSFAFLEQLKDGKYLNSYISFAFLEETTIERVILTPTSHVNQNAVLFQLVASVTMATAAD